MVRVTNLKNGEHEVVFSLPHEEGMEAVSVVGDFNDWDVSSDPMQRKGKGPWKAAVVLPAGEHQFRYRVNDDAWRDEDEAGRCANPYGGENCVIEI